MDLTDAQGRYSSASARASEIGRQLAFAGLATVWFFGGGTVGSDGGINVRDALVYPGLFFVLSLALDFSHAVYSATLWGLVARKNEKAGKLREISVTAKAHWVTLTLYWGKLACIGVAYVLLVRYFVDQL